MKVVGVALLLTLIVMLGVLGSKDVNKENCIQLARSIEKSHSRYSNEILFLESRMNKAGKSASKVQIREFNHELVSILERRLNFLKEALFGSDDSPSHCVGARLETLRSIAVKETAMLGGWIVGIK